MPWDTDALRLRLREERIARGVTLESVAEKARTPDGKPVKREAVYKWESGRNALPLYGLAAYEDALGLPIDVIVGGETPLPASLTGERATLAREMLDLVARIPDGSDTLVGLRAFVRSLRQNLK